MPDGHSLAIGTFEGRVGLWDIETCACRVEFKVSFSLRHISCRNLWFHPSFIEPHTPPPHFQGHAVPGGHRAGFVVYRVAASPDGRLLYSAGRDMTVHVWDVIGGGLISVLQASGSNNLRK